MIKNINLELPIDFIHQLLECLNQNIEDWHRTKIYLKDGDIDHELPYVRECEDTKEAEYFENYYRDIKALIENQLTNKPHN
ncbi:MAG: hypothetical protein A2Y10_06815 [Planctomycetes bacterium GWF2_41_51]|nr:MAG: hypothetical protein A2Y10_06815 [Planctomycetes bacterium GWF2_41_51]HBG27838.1 hypothetical protein [Phycisphaerales bacterium]